MGGRRLQKEQGKFQSAEETYERALRLVGPRRLSLLAGRAGPPLCLPPADLEKAVS